MVGYGIGYIAQGSTYNFMGAYFVIFLTNSVGLDSAMAAAITSIALLAEVISGMIVGNLSDNCKLTIGRRRPFILAAAICMPVIIVLLMRTIEGSTVVKFIYYLVLSVLFRTAFSTFEIPNNAFGAEIASGYDERTRLRTISRAFSIVGNAVGYVLPLWILDLFPANAGKGWQTIGCIVGAVAFCSWIASFHLTKDKDSPASGVFATGSRDMVRRIFRNYAQLCRLRAMRLLMVYKAGFSCAFALFNVATIYYLQYSLGLGNRYSSYMYVLTISVFIITTPIADKMARVFGKAKQQMIAMGMAACIGYFVFFFLPSSPVGAICYVIGFSIMQSSFWQLSGSIFYDIVEVDEFVNGKRREGDIMSLVSVLGTLTTAVMVQLFGVFFDLSGFDSGLAVQGEGAVLFLNIAYIFVPSLCFTAGCIALHLFPVNKKTFGALTSALELRRQGRDFSVHMEEIEQILR